VGSTKSTTVSCVVPKGSPRKDRGGSGRVGFVEKTQGGSLESKRSMEYRAEGECLEQRRVQKKRPGEEQRGAGGSNQGWGTRKRKEEKLAIEN